MPSSTRVFSLSEVRKHAHRSDAWIVIDGNVDDITHFLEDHPGGSETLLHVAGE